MKFNGRGRRANGKTQRYGRWRESRRTPTRGKVQDTRASPNSLETHLVRKWGDNEHQRAVGPRIYNTNYEYSYWYYCATNMKILKWKYQYYKMKIPILKFLCHLFIVILLLFFQFFVVVAAVVIIIIISSSSSSNNNNNSSSSSSVCTRIITIPHQETKIITEKRKVNQQALIIRKKQCNAEEL